eukprot:3457920-Rhodomonas_salina.1
MAYGGTRLDAAHCLDEYCREVEGTAECPSEECPSSLTLIDDLVLLLHRAKAISYEIPGTDAGYAPPGRENHGSRRTERTYAPLGTVAGKVLRTCNEMSGSGVAAALSDAAECCTRLRDVPLQDVTYSAGTIRYMKWQRAVLRHVCVCLYQPETTITIQHACCDEYWDERQAVCLVSQPWTLDPRP